MEKLTIFIAKRIRTMDTGRPIAEAVAVAAAERAQLLVGPTLALTVAQFNLGFAGTIAVRASVVQALIHDYLVSLAHHGFRYFYFVNGHGANVAVANAAF